MCWRGFTCVEQNSLARNTGAVIIHRRDLNAVQVATCEVVKATTEARGLTADVAVIAKGCHCVLDSTQTGRPRDKSSAVGAVHFNRDVGRNTWHCRQEEDNMGSEYTAYSIWYAMYYVDF